MMIHTEFKNGKKGKTPMRILALCLIFVLGLSGCLRSRGGSTGPIDLTFYGLDNSEVFDSLITKYRETHGNVRIKYKKFADPTEFENLLINEIAEGEGPDLFYIHNTWLPRHLKKIVPLVSEDLTPKMFSELFVNVATDDFIQPDPTDGNKKVYAEPLYVDTLALYYNKEHFEKKIPERGKPASTWELLKEDASKLRDQTEDGKLERGGVALGRADNLKLATDILYNFFLQAGVDFYGPDYKGVQFAGKGQETFDYFVSFAVPQNKNFSWSLDSVSADRPLAEVEAFLAGKVSSILAYSDLYPRLETELKNVRSRNPAVISMSDVAVAPAPQIATDESDYKVWANYYGLAVSRNSKHPAEAQEFIRFLASKESSRVYHTKTKRPTARRDLIEEQRKEPITEVFISQLGYAGSYRIYSTARFAEVFKVAIQSAVNGQTPRQVLSEAQSKINDVLKIEAPEGLYPKPKKKK